jgi:hypothetical protein
MADFSVQLAIESGELNDEQVGALEEATVGFLQNDVALENGKLHDIAVHVIGQLVIDVSNTNSTSSSNLTRSLFDSLSLEQKLLVDFSVSAMYSGSDDSFDLETELDSYFQDPKSRWLKWLSTADVVFESLSPEPLPEGETDSIVSETDTSNGSGVSGGTVAIVSLLAVAALAVGIAASVFSIRHFRRNAYGQELSSPRLSSEGLGSFIANENVEYHHQQIPFGAKSDLMLKQSNSEDDNAAAVSWRKPPATPNSLELGASIPIDQIMQKNPRSYKEKDDDIWNHIQPSKSESRIDPPTANSVINVPSREKHDQKLHDPRQMTSLFDTNVRNDKDVQSTRLMACMAIPVLYGCLVELLTIFSLTSTIDRNF